MLVEIQVNVMDWCCGFSSYLRSRAVDARYVSIKYLSLFHFIRFLERLGLVARLQFETLKLILFIPVRLFSHRTSQLRIIRFLKLAIVSFYRTKHICLTNHTSVSLLL